VALESRRATGRGQVVDVALYEAVFSVMESMLPEFDACGAIRERTGSFLPGIAPTSAYRCRDGSYVLIAANADSIFRRLCTAMGRADLAADPALAHNDGRAARQAWLDAEIERWTAERAVRRPGDDGGRRGAGVADLLHRRHRRRSALRGTQMIRTIALPGGRQLKVPGVVPRLSATPGDFAGGGGLGEHSDQVLGELGYDAAAIAAFARARDRGLKHPEVDMTNRAEVVPDRHRRPMRSGAGHAAARRPAAAVHRPRRLAGHGNGAFAHVCAADADGRVRFTDLAVEEDRPAVAGSSPPRPW
jgi:hypothetical protein